MKAVLISFNQAHIEDINNIMMHLNLKGFTGWDTVIGAGTKSGEPHLGSHAWPTLNSAYITVVDDAKARPLLDMLHNLDAESPQLGLRAFAWTVDEMI